MNKRQLIIAWIMGIGICLVLWDFYESYGHLSGVLHLAGSIERCTTSHISWIFMILIIGGLLIYTLKTRR